ncbi:MAG: DUF6198 family protein [Lachnospiraceae bacterium]
MNKLKRYFIFLIGLFISSLGVSLITKANLGTSPISSIPYVLSLSFPLTLGNFTILFSIFLILLQLCILRKNFKAEDLLQIPISFLFGYFIDYTMGLLDFVNPQNYFIKMIYLLIGCLILGFGVYTEVVANVAMLPGESFVRAVVETWNYDFGKIKVLFDVSMTIIAAGISLVFFHQLNGVREGTVIAALLVGFIARVLGRWLAFIKPFLFPEDFTGTKSEASETTAMLGNGKNVIVLGRQYGCNASGIGRLLAKKLGYSFYDEEIIQIAAGTTGYMPEFIKNKEEIMTNSLLYDLVNQMYTYSSEHETPKDKIFETESHAIKELAEMGNCIIVGRCADYILRNEPNCLRIFLHAPLESRIRRVMKQDNVDEKEAAAKVQKEDRRRADNYRYYTRKIWGAAANYHLSIDTDLGVEYIETSIQRALKSLPLKVENLL